VNAPVKCRIRRRFSQQLDGWPTRRRADGFFSLHVNYTLCILNDSAAGCQRQCARTHMDIQCIYIYIRLYNTSLYTLCPACVVIRSDAVCILYMGPACLHNAMSGIVTWSRRFILIRNTRVYRALCVTVN